MHNAHTTIKTFSDLPIFFGGEILCIAQKNHLKFLSADEPNTNNLNKKKRKNQKEYVMPFLLCSSLSVGNDYCYCCCLVERS